jgi:hypothetical protein
MFIYDATEGFWKLIGGDRELMLTSVNQFSASNTFSGAFYANAGVGYQIKTKSSAYTTTADDFIITATSGTWDLTLVASNAAGITQCIKNSGTGVITILTSAGGTIDGLASGEIKLRQYDCIWLHSIGTNTGWKILHWYENLQADLEISGLNALCDDDSGEAMFDDNGEMLFAI